MHKCDSSGTAPGFTYIVEREELERLDSAHRVPEHQRCVHTLVKFLKLTRACCMNDDLKILAEEEDQRNVNIYIKYLREGCWGD
jgi:hypothetical protein